MGRKERRIHYQKMRKKVIQWSNELHKLWRSSYFHKNKEVVDLATPRFVGYIVSFRLTPLGHANMVEDQKNLFNKHLNKFLVFDKNKAKKEEPDFKKSMWMGRRNFSSPDLPELKGDYFWPVVFESESYFKNNIPRHLRKHFSFYEAERFYYDGKSEKIYYLDIPQEYFETYKNKYHQKKIWVEPAWIDSRIDFLEKKLWYEKLEQKYGRDTGSSRDCYSIDSEDVYLSDKNPITPSLPYKRAKFTRATDNIIDKEIINEV